MATATPTDTPTASPTETETATATPTATQVPARRTVATGLTVPWGIAFLPDGDALVAERDTARILRIPAGGGEPREEMQVPGVNTSAGEGGLLGLAVSPDYERDRLVYAYFTSGADNRIVRFRLGGQVRTGADGDRRGRDPQRRPDRVRARRQALRGRRRRGATRPTRRTASRSTARSCA